MNCIKPKYITIKYPERKQPFLDEYEAYNHNKIMLVPCGKCLGCKTDYAIEWAKRCIHQTRISKNNYFLTLTYDDAHLPLTIHQCADDMRLFIARLRRHKQFIKLKYLYVVERGKTTNRLHVHALMWNLPLSDKQFFKMSGTNPLFVSLRLTQIWGHGNILIGELNELSAMYTLKYSYKEINNETVLKRQSNGIGKAWFMKNINWAKYFAKNKYYNKLKNQILTAKEKLQELKLSQKKWLEKNGKNNFIDIKQLKIEIEKNKAIQQSKKKLQNRL